MRHLSAYLKTLPWRMILIGQGMLYLLYGLIALALAPLVLDPLLAFLQALSREQAATLYGIGVRLLLIAGLLCIALPTMVGAIRRLLYRAPPTVEAPAVSPKERR